MTGEVKMGIGYTRVDLTGNLVQDPKVILFENREPEPAECGES